MGGIPLPALAVNPPQQPDLLGQMGKLSALRGGQLQQQNEQLEIQQKQQELKDSQAANAATEQWDGKDPEALIGLLIKNKASAKTVLGYKSAILKQQMDYSQKAKTDAETGSKLLEQDGIKHDMLAGQIRNVLSLPDEQLAAGAQQALQQSMQSGLIKPEEAQQFGAITQLPPDQLRTQLQFMEKHFMGDKAQREAAVQQVEATKNTALTAQANAETALKTQEAQFYQNNGMGAPGVPSETAQMADAIKRGVINSPSQWSAYKAKQEAVATYPEKLSLAKAEGQARADVAAQTARGSNAAVATVPPHLVPAATSAATKAGEDYAQAQSVTQRLNAMMDAARKGNVVSYQVIPEEGTLQITTSQGVHRINQAEISQYAGGGSLWQRLLGRFGKATTGASIPKSVLDDMAEVQKIQSQGSQLKYNNSLKTINQTYGAKFEPVQMDEMPSVSTAPSAGGFDWNSMPRHQ